MIGYVLPFTRLVVDFCAIFVAKDIILYSRRNLAFRVRNVRGWLLGTLFVYIGSLLCCRRIGIARLPFPCCKHFLRSECGEFYKEVSPLKNGRDVKNGLESTQCVVVVVVR
jgi:hypothetical protein